MWELKSIWIPLSLDDYAQKKTEELDEYLKDGWEPFAVTENNSSGTSYHLRRMEPIKE